MPNTVTLCGSTRYLKHFEEANIQLTRRGLSVISISMALPKQPDGTESEQGLKFYLDLVHLNKILISDAIFVVGDGYIGQSTAREILWAEMQQKGIVSQWGVEAESFSVHKGSWDRSAWMLSESDFRDKSLVNLAKDTLGIPQ
jgi:hypothetical protein